MRSARWGTIAILSVGAVITGYGQHGSPANRPWPPPVQDVSSVSPALSPTDALKTFVLPPGYRVELVASEPLVRDPVAIDWDPEGRLWVVEMPGYMRDIAGRGEHDPIGRIVVLRDDNDDGRMDTRKVFADGLVMPRAVKVLERGVLVGEPPHVWLMRDTDGDLRADTRTLVTREYGRLAIDPQNNANGLHWGLDNRIHLAGQADILLRLGKNGFDVQRTLRRGQWGVTHDDAGRIYRNTNESALHVNLVPTVYFERHPSLLRTRGSYERLADQNPDLNVIWPARRTPGTNRAYQSGILRDDGSLARFTAVCAPLVYRGDRLPADLQGNVFVAEPAANLVSRLVLEDAGGMVRARKAYERGEFLASTDERFRPVYLSDAPDGTLYVVDMYRGVLEHRLSLTEYLRDHIVARQLVEPTAMGRIYRVVHETSKRDTSRALSTASPAQLTATLAHPNGWRRDTAQRLLVERADRGVVPPLVALASRAPDWRTRLQALWTLDGMHAIEPAVVSRALDDDSWAVRAAAVRLAERWLGEPQLPLHAAVMTRVDDGDWAVRRQLAASLGALPMPAREAAAVAVLDAHALDPVTMDAAISSLRGVELSVLESMIEPGRAQTPQREASIAVLAATIVRGGQETAVQSLFDAVAAAHRAAWQRSSLVSGLEIALLGAAMPGSPPLRATAVQPPAPCPTCPGGRAGPGGAYAYPRPPGSGTSGEGSRPVLRLNREPSALTRLIADGDLTARVSRVLDRVSWPGKPGDAIALAPLAAAEQQRFDAGREIYRNICQSCHQPDGRGLDKVAPTLIGSALTLGPADVPARILLHGKEGAVGLMPPIGATLADEEIASVLTYVRREWGQAGTPVGPAVVSATRALTTGRTRPWTDEELVKLAGSGRP